MLQLGVCICKICSNRLQLQGKLKASRGELLDIRADEFELLGGGIERAELGLELEGLFVDVTDTGVAIGLEVSGNGGGAAELEVGGGELLLEGDVGGGEALVVEEEGLEVVVLGGEAVFEDLRGVRKRVRVLEERGMGKDWGFVVPEIQDMWGFGVSSRHASLSLFLCLSLSLFLLGLFGYF